MPDAPRKQVIPKGHVFTSGSLTGGGVLPVTLTLIGDTADVLYGKYYYGTDVNGTKGWHPFPASGGGGFSGLYTDLDFTASNLTSIATRLFSSLQSIPTTLSGYGITDAVPITRTINSLALSSNIVLSTSDISDSLNKRYVTDANLVVIGNTSGTNTGDQSLAGLVPTSRTLTIGGTALDLSANRSWLSSVTNDAQTKASIVPNTAPSAGQILAGNAGGTAYAPVSLSGSGATMLLASTGVLTISAIANASLSGNTSGWDTAVTEKRQWDGGATNLVAATGRTSLGLVIGTNVQAWDTDLDTWATITPAAGVGTFLATPSSANLRAALTDENGTGAALFSGATSPDFTTGITIGGAAASGKILMGDGTRFAPSTPTFPTSAGTASYDMRSNGTNFITYPSTLFNSSVSSQSPSTTDVYIAGSNVVVAAGDFKAKGQYRCVFDLVKSAGTGAIVISVRTGTAGTTSDVANLTFTFAAGTSVADTGTFEVIVNWRTVGTGTSAVVSGVCRAQKNTITAAGLWGDTSAAKTIVATVSSGFNSSTFTNIGISLNGGTAFAGTITTVQARLMQP